MKNLTIYFLLIFTLFSCKEKVVDGIEIGHTLYTNQSFEQNKKLSELITQTLNKNSNGLSELTEFWCGGGAGCYDLGIITSEIVYKMGESEFIKIASELESERKNSLKGLLNAGLEYGYEPDRKIENEFPKLNKILTE
ncbi:hypothetical protein [Aequorivita capsosiphonis]|uniref:hypothetical protein n=1 Tax=Aequorivita capsosiphonis TaxID=487317 RepID=UPI0004792CFB|nr:hypothetical protein [Aequorivita capsosiphonis]|tara:strand:- start:884 stop:1297 length:414 start_codon:yes stop_codon:yes gene_type:complete